LIVREGGSASVTRIDDLLAEALRRAPAHLADVPPRGRAEAELEEAVRLGLTEAGAPADRVGARRRYIDGGWSPLPGALDLYMTHADSDLSWVAELKYAKVDETLWDLIKISCAFDLRQSVALEGAYLIVAAGKAAWTARGDCSELFSRRGRTRRPRPHRGQSGCVVLAAAGRTCSSVRVAPPARDPARARTGAATRRPEPPLRPRPERRR
jgi:hypothetical protein